LFNEKIELKIINILMQTINMLIPDLLNVLFDQCDYDGITVMRMMNKRKTTYANKYSLLRYYGLGNLTLESIGKCGNIKSIKSVCVHSYDDIFCDISRFHAFDGCSLVVKYVMSECALQWSAENGYLETVKYLANVVGVNIHADDDAALRRSAGNGYLEIVKYLVSVGANIHAFYDDALIMSAENGRLETVKYLVSEGANIHAGDDDALRCCVDKGHLETVKYLVSEGANIHAGDDYALRWSAMKGHLEIVKYLANVAGANIHACDDSALLWSAGSGHLETVEYLVNVVGANIHADDDCALRWSAKNGHLETVKYLVSVGANIHANNNELQNNEMIQDHFSHLFV